MSFSGETSRCFLKSYHVYSLRKSEAKSKGSSALQAGRCFMFMLIFYQRVVLSKHLLSTTDRTQIYIISSTLNSSFWESSGDTHTETVDACVHC